MCECPVVGRARIITRIINQKWNVYHLMVFKREGRLDKIRKRYEWVLHTHTPPPHTHTPSRGSNGIGRYRARTNKTAKHILEFPQGTMRLQIHNYDHL